MIGFKDFYLKEEKSAVSIPNLDNLLLNDHDSVGIAADMADGVHNILSGKKSKIKTLLDYPGQPVTFGYSPDSKKLEVIHDGKRNVTFEDIANNYKDNPQTAQIISDLSKHLPTILPPKTKMYNGTILGSDPQKIALSINSDEKGVPLKNSDRMKFKQSPSVYNLNPELTANPNSHNLENQQMYLMHMNAAKKHYGKIDPEIYDYIAGHGKNILKYVNNSISINKEPNSNDYLEDLKQQYMGKILRTSSEVTKNNRSKRFTELANEVSTNHKHFDDFIKFLYHFKQGVNVLGQSLPHDLTVFHNDRMVKIKKTKLNEEVVTTSVAMASDGAVRGLGYVSGNPAGNGKGYIQNNIVDSDQRNNLLFKYIKDNHHRHHHSKGKK